MIWLECTEEEEIQSKLNSYMLVVSCCALDLDN